MTNAAENAGVITAPARLTVEHAVDFLASVRERAAFGSDLTIDLSAVAAADTAGVQLLAMLRRELQDRGVQLDLQSPSAAVTGSAELLGLGHLFAQE